MLVKRGLWSLSLASHGSGTGGQAAPSGTEAPHALNGPHLEREGGHSPGSQVLLRIDWLNTCHMAL